MSTNVYYDELHTNATFDKVIHYKCKCGHELYQHGFVMHRDVMGQNYLAVSQCCMCSVDVKNNKFGCKEFHSA